MKYPKVISARYAIVTATCLVVLTSCRTVTTTEYQDEESDYSGLGRSNVAGRCNTVLPNMKEIATPILKQVLAVANGQSPTESMAALTLAKGIEQMLMNMTRDEHYPILPIHFFAMIKDFETADDIHRWSQPNKPASVFTTRNCTSKQCFGYFQVDVKLEREWSLRLCGPNALNIAQFRGGYDFCAALFWWIKSSGGDKCQRVNPGRAANPCLASDYAWTRANVANGRNPYGQLPQREWKGTNGWADKYDAYTQCGKLDKTKNLQIQKAEFWKSMKQEP